MVYQYVQKPISILQSVVMPNTNPATSKSLYVANAIDLAVDRAMTGVTNIYIVDAGTTDATALLSGAVMPIKLSMIAVVNQLQRDLDDQRIAEQVLLKERWFFEVLYSVMPTHTTLWRWSTNCKWHLRNVNSRRPAASRIHRQPPTGRCFP